MDVVGNPLRELWVVSLREELMISKKVAARLAMIVLATVVVVAGSALAATTTISGTLTTNVQVVRSGTAGEWRWRESNPRPSVSLRDFSERSR